MKILVGVLVVIIIGLSWLTVKVINKGDAKAKLIKRVKRLTKENEEFKALLLEHLDARTELTKRIAELTKENEVYEALLLEHNVIFENLENDPTCLSTAVQAYNDVCDVLEEEDDCDLFITAISANLNYDRISENYYKHDTNDITISLFDDYEEEQGQFIYDYINEKFGTNLNGSDVRTRTIFTILHELGHYVDYRNKREVGANEYEVYLNSNYKQLQSIIDIEDEEERWRVYRELPNESFADKFAVDFMMKHFSELC